MRQLPDALAPLGAYKQFIIHRNKVPWDLANNCPGDAHNPAMWMDAPTALAMAEALGEPHGVGFVLTDDNPVFCLDIDGCNEGDKWSALAMEMMARFKGAAVEVSLSGNGIHIWGLAGALPPHRNKAPGGVLELYTTKRFIAITGKGAIGNAGTDHTPALLALIASHLQPTGAAEGPAEWTTEPVPEWQGPDGDAELIERALRAVSAGAAFEAKASFRHLWYGDTDALGRFFPDPAQGRAYDSSSADMALATHLAFWTGRNCERIQELMRQSALNRDKWEQRPDYLQRTIMQAVLRQEQVYTGGRAGDPVAPPPPPEAGSGQLVSGFQFLAVDQQLAYFRDMVYVQDQHRIMTPEGTLLKPEQFKSTYGGYVFSLDAQNDKTTRNAWEAFTESQAIRHPKVHGRHFRPQEPPGAITTLGGLRYVNSWVPRFGEQVAGDVGPFLRHVQLLLPVERDREILLDYLAACLQLVGIKFQWCVLLQGAQGNGKTIFYKILEYALGRQYVHKVNPQDLGNVFNAWIEGKIFAVIEEIRVAGRHEIADILKALITDDAVAVQGKGLDQRLGENIANFLMLSNYKDAVLKNRGDRRYCVMYCNQQDPADLQRDGMDDAYFRGLYGWLRTEGLPAVAHYLANRQISIHVDGRAPATSSTEEAYRASLGTAEQLILDAVEMGEPGFRGGLICTRYATNLLANYGKRLSPQRLITLLNDIGYVRHPLLDETKGRIKVAGSYHRLYVKIPSIAASIASQDELAAMFKKSLAA
ncbi:MAG: phage NrS-1 polymerase family protein [Planctomycetota bacterium]|jgi:hypothetical protein